MLLPLGTTLRGSFADPDIIDAVQDVAKTLKDLSNTIQNAGAQVEELVVVSREKFSPSSILA